MCIQELEGMKPMKKANRNSISPNTSMFEDKKNKAIGKRTGGFFILHHAIH